MMLKFAIVHGRFKHPSHLVKEKDVLTHPHADRMDGGFLGPSLDAAEPHVIELDSKEAEKMDPGCTKSPWAGTCLKPLELHTAELRAAAASKAELDKVVAPSKPVVAPKLAASKAEGGK